MLIASGLISISDLDELDKAIKDLSMATSLDPNDDEYYKNRGLIYHFVFDTGTSIISIPSVEANFMLKNKYLSRQNFIGKERFITASGDIS